jgi:histidinol-phosphate aminotransferase
VSSVASSTAAGPPPGMRVRLSSNESPYGVSPAALAAAQLVTSELHLYPDDQSVALRQALAKLEGTDMASVSIGTGSSGILMDLVASECHDGQGSVLAYDRAFIVYRLAARNAGVAYVEAPTAGPATQESSGYARDPQALLDAIDDTTRIVIVDNPGNPTGAHLDADGLRAVVAGVPEHVVLVIDEAYWQYGAGHAGYARVRDLDVTHPRLIVTSTFSKAHALAGLRIGYVTGAAEVVQAIDGWRPRFNANAIGQAAAVASLADTDHMDATVRQTIEQRRRTADGLRALGIPFTDGLGNFLTFELGTEAGPVVEAFASRGVGIRPLQPYGMTQQIRVSIGLATDTDDFLTAAADVLSDVPARG